MTDNLRESISALMDDEANELELHRVLNQMEHNDEVRSYWKRLQLTRSAMNKELDGRYHVDISARISEALKEEVPELSPALSNERFDWNRLVRPVTGVAVAASVAFLVMFGAVQINAPEQGGPSVAQQDTQPIQASEIDGSALSLASLDAGAVELTPLTEQELSESERHLRSLIDSHTQQAAIARSSSIGLVKHETKGK